MFFSFCLRNVCQLVHKFKVRCRFSIDHGYLLVTTINLNYNNHVTLRRIYINRSNKINLLHKPTEKVEHKLSLIYLCIKM